MKFAARVSRDIQTAGAVQRYAHIIKLVLAKPHGRTFERIVAGLSSSAV